MLCAEKRELILLEYFCSPMYHEDSNAHVKRHSIDKEKFGENSAVNSFSVKVCMRSLKVVHAQIPLHRSETTTNLESASHSKHLNLKILSLI